ncbi:Na+/H+ antiporter [Herbiconiux daphne]|uniref:Na+/H+ antiporter n=1 Tax=Herbiconiux daphne TaxID=2970914 RepID=A0ABT2H384_9MICO|nr:Na+/H+ antiporter [Herbiconiux daphne]MCS5734375.1 Na+/H+ antiporter [Herbiconiux daphne]
MEGLELVVIIGLTIMVGGVIARLLHIAPPLVLLALGAAVGFIPALENVALPPDVVLLLFLPALLYWESINTSLREIRNNIRVISLAAIGLVLVTALVVGVVAAAFGLPWPIALALGAILAPTDATAISSVAGGLPRRSLTTLRAESLINDGTALVLYGVAVTAAVAGSGISLGSLTLEFVLSYAVAIAVGLAVGFIVVWVRRFLHESPLENTLSVLTPFLAFLPAELLHVSGVVAVVVCGLVVSQGGPRWISARTRVQGFGFWEVATYILNGSLFVLIGLQFHLIVTGLDADAWQLVGWLSAAAIVLVIGIRIAWFNTTPYIIRLLDRRPTQRARRVTARRRFPLAWAGFRGAVSLAAALALPLETAAGEALPGRDVLIAVTFAVILFTLLVQGLTMPAVVRWARLPPDPTEAYENLLAERVGLEAVVEAIPQAAVEVGAPDEVRDGMLTEYRERIDRVRRSMDDEHETIVESEAEDDSTDYASRLRLAVLPAKRAAIIRLRDDRRIDDTVLRRIQARVDAEELRLTARSDQEEV